MRASEIKIAVKHKGWFTCAIVLIRIGLGLLFIFSGYMKAQNLDGFAAVIYKIEFIPYDLAQVAALLIVASELFLGGLLALGLYLLQTLWVTGFLLIVFTAFLGAVLIFKWEVSGCGCFGRFSKNNISFFEIARNTFLIALTALLMRYRNNGLLFSIDRFAKSVNRNTSDIRL